VLAFSFIKKHQFAIKTNRNSLFLGRETHILDQLYIIVLYISFYEFKKIKFWHKIRRCWLRFYQKRQFVIKTDWNSLILGHKAHVRNQVYIIFMYISFYEFWKFSNFGLKSKGVSFGSYRKALVCDKNWQKLYIYWPWSINFESVIHNGYIYKFYGFSKFSYFASKSKGVSLRF
jgi:hypothetical protein